MGIHPDIRDLLMHHCVGRLAFSHLSKNPDKAFQGYATLWRQSGVDIAEDTLTRMNATVGPQKDYTTTPRELIEAIAREVDFFARCVSPNIDFIFILDDPNGVPKEKHDTQAKRSRQSKTIAYPPEAKIVEEGVQIASTEQPERIDIQRLLATRRLRPAMWQYGRQHLHEAHVLDPRMGSAVGPDTTIFFEWHESGPARYDFDEDAFQFKPGVPQPQLMHKHGEADISMMYWMERSTQRKRHTLLKTIDSDVYPISFLRMPPVDPLNPRGITLQLQLRGNTECRNSFIDLRRLKKATMKRLKLTPISFAMFCILCGTDYVPKKLTTHEIGSAAILQGVQALSDEIHTIWSHDINNDADERRSRFTSLRRLLAAIYYHFDPKTQAIWTKLYKRKCCNEPLRAIHAVKVGKDWGSLLTQTRLGDDSLSHCTTPTWQTIHSVLSIAVENDERIKAIAAKIKVKNKKRKNPNDDETHELKNLKKDCTTTELRPPSVKELEDVVLDKIWFNMNYWRGVTRKQE